MSWKKSSTLDSTITNSITEPSGRVTYKNTKKCDTLRKACTMQMRQFNDSTSTTPDSPEWIHVTINKGSCSPPPWSSRNTARRARRTMPYTSLATLLPLAQITWAHHDNRWHRPVCARQNLSLMDEKSI